MLCDQSALLRAARIEGINNGVYKGLFGLFAADGGGDDQLA